MYLRNLGNLKKSVIFKNWNEIVHVLTVTINQNVMTFYSISKF